MQSGVGKAHNQFAMEAFAVAFLHFHRHDGAKSGSVADRKGGSEEIGGLQQFGVDQRGISAGTALYGKVVEHRDFDAVNIVAVFVGATAAHQQVVAVGIADGEYARH